MKVRHARAGLKSLLLYQLRYPVGRKNIIRGKRLDKSAVVIVPRRRRWSDRN